MKPIILASQSPRRRQLLEWAEIPFEVKLIETDENYPLEMPVEEVPVFIARNKALAILPHISKDNIVLAADTIVVYNNEIIGKPAHREHAIEILKKLSGNTHRVITGVCILHSSGEKVFYDITHVQFHHLTEDEISYYVDQYQPYDKAGAYAIQEWIGVVGIAGVQGDFYNVMGLPVSKVVQCLRTIL